MAQWANILGAAVQSAWLVRQGVGSSPAPAGMSSQVSDAMRLNSWAGTEGSPVSSLNCDRPSHLDWGRLGVVRAASVDNRWQGLVVLYTKTACWHLPEKPAGLAGLYKYTVQAPGLEGTWPGLG